MSALLSLFPQRPSLILAHLGMLKVPSLENLNHAFFFLRCAKFILQRRVACRVVCVLSAVPDERELDISNNSDHVCLAMTGRAHLLVSNEDLEATDHLS